MRFCTRSCVQIFTTSTIFSAIRSEARSCGITLTHAASESYRRSALLCVVNVDHFLCFFIRELLTHIFHHVTLILCMIWGSRLNSLSDGKTTFCFAIPTARLSLSVIALSTPLSFNFARWFTTADNQVFVFDSDQSLAGSLASSSRSAPAVPRQSSAPAGWSSRARDTPSASCRALPGVVVTSPKQLTAATQNTQFPVLARPVGVHNHMSKDAHAIFSFEVE